VNQENSTDKKIGNYQIIEEIGRGGNAIVYLAFDEKLARPVALKVLHAFAHHPNREKIIERFRRGAQAAARLNHPNILPVYDFGEWQGTFYIVMQHVQGQTLRQYLLGEIEEIRAVEPLAPSEAVDIVRQVGAALAYAHRHNVVHRDVKPSNILLAEDGRVYLADFGLARVEDAAPITQSGETLGTPHYMSPEQGQGMPVDHRSDTYSLGVVTFHMLTGQVPFDAETPIPVIVKHTYPPLPAPRSINPNIPQRVEAVLAKALAKTPAERYQSVQEFVNDLEAAAAIQQAVPGAAPPPPAAWPTRPTPAPETPPPAPTPTSAPPRRETMRWSLVAVILVAFVGLLLCSVVAFFLLGGRDLLLRPTASPTQLAAMTPTPTYAAAMLTATSPSVPTATDTPPAAALTPTVEPTQSPSQPSPGAIDTLTATAAPPTATPTASPTVTATATATPTPTATATPTSPAPITVGMVLIPAGNFIQGSSDAEIDAALQMCNDAYGGVCPQTRDWFADEAPRRTVYLDAFYIDQWEVTNQQFAEFVATTGYVTDAEKKGESQTWRTANAPGRGKYPVVWMSWNDADAYCRWDGKRLPSEAEWEKAARGSDGRIWPWGSNWNNNRANTGDGGPGSVTLVGSYPSGASPYGVMDTTGNVWEWVADWYDALWYSNSPLRNPGGPPAGVSRVLRGGGFRNPPWEVRAVHRHSGGPDGYAPDHGFRCAK